MYCHYFICERKFYARYARKNYAALEINPKKELVFHWVREGECTVQLYNQLLHIHSPKVMIATFQVKTP